MDIKKSLHMQHQFIFLLRVNIELIALCFNCRMLSTDDRKTIQQKPKRKRNQNWYVQKIKRKYRRADFLHSSFNYGT